MLDNMAKRYGMLPSQVLREATTQDVYVLDMALSYEHYVREKHDQQNASQAGRPHKTPKTMDQLHDQLSGNDQKELEKRFLEWKKTEVGNGKI